MSTLIDDLIERYISWLRDKTVLRQVGDWVEITTPYLDRHNDYIQIYALRQGDAITLTDDGAIIEDLESSGCKLDTPKRRELLELTLSGFGVRLRGDQLSVSANLHDFALRKHNLIQSMLAVNDLFYLASPTVASLFLDDVMAWLDEHRVRYSPKVKFTGKSGYDHLFDFVIPRSPSSPERVLKAFNRPSRESTQTMAFAWVDTKEVRPPEAKAYAILNDTEGQVSPAVVDALKSYDVEAIPWSSRDDYLSELAA